MVFVTAASWSIAMRRFASLASVVSVELSILVRSVMTEAPYKSLDLASNDCGPLVWYWAVIFSGTCAAAMVSAFYFPSFLYSYFERIEKTNTIMPKAAKKTPGQTCFNVTSMDSVFIVNSPFASFVTFFILNNENPSHMHMAAIKQIRILSIARMYKKSIKCPSGLCYLYGRT